MNKGLWKTSRNDCESWPGCGGCTWQQPKIKRQTDRQIERQTDRQRMAETEREEEVKNLSCPMSEA